MSVSDPWAETTPGSATRLNKMTVITEDGTTLAALDKTKHKPVVCTSKTIHDYEDLLEDSGFVRVHKSFLVNLLHVKEYLRGEGGSIILTNGKEIEVSRRKKDIFLSKMKEFYKF